MSTALQIAEYLEDMDMFGIETADSTKAGLYSVRGETTELVAEHGDVYELLGSPASYAVANLSDAVVLRTNGWAAPRTGDEADDEVAPSKHPERRRVRLLVVAKAGETVSVLRFTDDWANPIFDEGQATGSLADAVQSLFI